LFLSFQAPKDLVEAVESLVPGAPVACEPGVELPERLRTELVDPLLAGRACLDDPGVAENAEVLRDLGLTHPEPLDDLPHREWLEAKELDDLQPVRFRESAQDLLHGIYIPLQIYICQGISWDDPRMSPEATSSAP